MSEKATKIDAHCHLFNLMYLVSELCTMAYDATLGGGYPRGKAAVKGVALAGAAPPGLLPSLSSLIRQVVQLGGSLFNSYEENYKLLKRNYLTVFKDETDLIVFPLMMDIYFMFDGYFASAKPIPKSVQTVMKPEEEFEKWFMETKDLLRADFEQKRRDSFSTYRTVLIDPDITHLDDEMDRLFRDLTSESSGPFLASSTSTAVKTVMTPGYKREIESCIKLQQKYEGRVFPFLAVDPRRGNVMDLVKTENIFGVKQLVSHSGPFYGIKVYPRLGYDADALEKIGLLAWCAENDMPITVHSSEGGFPPFDEWKWRDNSDPSSWEGLIKVYQAKKKPLHIDFAHYGDKSTTWRQKITDYVCDKDNLYGKHIYTDISCYTKETALKTARTFYDTNWAAMRNKLMFGTDYDVMLLTDRIDLQDYFKQFLRFFKDSPEKSYSEELMANAPRAFLNAQGAGAASLSATAVPQKTETGVRRKLEKELRLGWLRDLPDVRDYSVFTSRLSSRQKELNLAKPVNELILPLLESAPKRLSSSVDLRGWCSPVEDQRQLGSCTANAAVGLVEFFERKASGHHIDASRLFLYKATRRLLGWTGDTGAYLRTALEALVVFGVPPEAYYPYDIDSFDAEPESFAYAFAQNYKALSYFRLDPVGTQAQELLLAIKTVLAAGIPSIFGFSVYDSISEAKTNRGKVPYPAASDRLCGGHAVMAVGYNDDMEIYNTEAPFNPTRGALLFRNSWGTDWGDEGYGWLPYEYVLRGLAVDWWSIIKQDWIDTNAFD